MKFSALIKKASLLYLVWFIVKIQVFSYTPFRSILETQTVFSVAEGRL